MAQLKLAGHPLPAPCAHVWAWFCELHASRQGGGFGPGPIGHAGILAWQTLTGIRPTRQEIDWLLALDLTWLVVQATEHDPEA